METVDERGWQAWWAVQSVAGCATGHADRA